MARHFDTIARLWDRIGDMGIGFCLDTCHAWAAGEALIDAVGGSRRSPEASTWSTATTPATPPVPGPTGMPTSAPARSTRNCWSPWSKRPGPVICETADEGRRADIAFLRGERLDQVHLP